MALTGRPTDYRPEYDEKIVELARQELSMWEIAASFDVAYKTMWNWTKSIETFCNAYARAKTIQIGNIFKEVRNNKSNHKYNHNLPSMRLKHEGGLGDNQKVLVRDISKGSHSDKANKILVELEEGELTADDAVKLTNVVATIAKIDEVTDLRTQVEELEDEQGK